MITVAVLARFVTVPGMKTVRRCSRWCRCRPGIATPMMSVSPISRQSHPMVIGTQRR
jgi:hypothetical protein